jgi:hypothetical protein
MMIYYIVLTFSFAFLQNSHEVLPLVIDFRFMSDNQFLMLEMFDSDRC